MKRIFTTFFLMTFLFGIIQAQIVINEIMYNSPYTFTAGTSIGANAYLLVAGDAQAMMDSYGVMAIQWESGGLSNSGEDIELVDASGSVIDLVDYQDAFPEVSSNVFTPADITVFVGETVQWNNVGGFHNVNGTLATYPNNPEGFGNGVIHMLDLGW